MRNVLCIVFIGVLMLIITGCEKKNDPGQQDQIQTDQAVSVECDRKCLEGFVDQYLQKSDTL